PARGAGLWWTRSTSTSPRPSWRPPSMPASTRATRATTRTACWRRCAGSSAATPSSGRAAGAEMVVRTHEEARENPLVEGLERLPVPPTSLVIFGVTGDLARRKLLPALYNLAHEGALPEHFELVGVAR